MKLEMLDLALFYKGHMIISDVHIGYEEMLNKSGYMLPRHQYKDTEARLLRLLRRKPQRIVINGDLKHEFVKISDQEWRDTLKILDLLGENVELILVRGNHDTVLDPITDKRQISVRGSYIVDDIMFVHGDQIVDIPEEVRTIVIGHEHPAVSISDGVRSEIYKCFLKGKYKGKTLIVQPSFNLVTEGTDVTKEELLSPYIKDIKSFEVFVVGEKIHPFGKVRDLLQNRTSY